LFTKLKPEPFDKPVPSEAQPLGKLGINFIEVFRTGVRSGGYLTGRAGPSILPSVAGQALSLEQ